jgi:hypothetical protein
MRGGTRAEPAALQVAEASAEQLTRPAGLRLAEPSEQAGMTAAQVAPLERVLDAHESVERSKEPVRVAGARERIEENAQIFRSLDDRPAQPSAPATEVVRASAPASLSTTQIALIAFAAISFLVSSILYLAGARRRRARIEIVDLNARTPLRALVVAQSRTMSRRMPADDDMGVDQERLRRFAQAWRQQPA